MSAIVGVIIVDHGSRRRESNEMLHEATARFAAQSEFSIVEPAHMELAEPSIAQAFDRCVSRGATEVIVFPYFLSPGRHWTEDIPRLAAAAGLPGAPARPVRRDREDRHAGLLPQLHDPAWHQGLFGEPARRRAVQGV